MTRLLSKSILLLLSTFISVSGFAQDFVLEPAQPVIVYEGACGDNIIDTPFSIRNVTSNAIFVTVGFTPANTSSSWPRSARQFTIGPSMSVPISISFSGTHLDSGIYPCTITVSDGTASIDLDAKAALKPYAVGSHGWQDAAIRGIPVGATRCATYWGRNRTQKPITVYKIMKEEYSGKLFTINPKVPFPYVILPGEDLPLCDVCFTATKPNEEADTRLAADASDYEGKDDQLPFNFSVSSIIDSTLLKPCVELIFPKEFAGPVLIGGDKDEEIYIQSNRYTQQSVMSFNFTTGDASSFSIVGTTFPLVLDSLERKTLTLRFSPRDTAPLVKYRYAVRTIADAIACNSPALDLIGMAMLPTADNVATPLLPDKSYVLGMTGSAPTFTKDFHFVNNGSSNVKVTSVGFTNPSPEFSIANIAPSNVLPFTLQTSDKMTVTVRFTPSKPNKLFTNTLVITTVNGIQSATYELQALQSGTASVRSNEELVNIQVTPNPASANVRVSLEDASADKIEVFDVLGNSVATAEGSYRQWTWDVRSANIPAGSYFVRIAGKTDAGNAFKVSKTLIIE